jgi:hypothetical protein
MEIDPAELVRQFIVSPVNGFMPPAWPTREKAGLYLAAHPSLPVLDALTEDGAHIGYLLGWPITPEGTVAHDSITLPVRKDELMTLTPNGETRGEECLYALAGRWVFALIADEACRLYLDPCGSQAAVYSPLLQIASATTALIPRTPDTGDDDELVQLMDIPNKDRWFPFGLTPRRSCRRLLPNHYLDLKQWTTHRHWPTGNLPANPNTSDAANVVAAAVKKLIRATVADRPVQCSLTAGQDTRMFLACARDELDRVLFHTREDYSWSSERDVYVAKHLARRFGLKYQLVERVVTPEADLAAWLDRTGRCVSGNAWRSATMIDSFQRESFTLTGIAGGIARAYYWRDGDTPDTEVTVPLIIGRTKLPLNNSILHAGERWLAELPFSDALLTFDLFVLEQRVACYSSPSRYGYTSPAVMMYPLAHRASIEAMLRLPSDYKRQEKLHKDIIAREWPDLLSVPLNEDIGWRRIRNQTRRLFSTDSIKRVGRAVWKRANVRGRTERPEFTKT